MVQWGSRSGTNLYQLLRQSLLQQTPLSGAGRSTLRDLPVQKLGASHCWGWLWFVAPDRRIYAEHVGTFLGRRQKKSPRVNCAELCSLPGAPPRGSRTHTHILLGECDHTCLQIGEAGKSPLVCWSYTCYQSNVTTTRFFQLSRPYRLRLRFSSTAGTSAPVLHNPNQRTRPCTHPCFCLQSGTQGKAKSIREEGDKRERWSS